MEVRNMWKNCEIALSAVLCLLASEEFAMIVWYIDRI